MFEEAFWQSVRGTLDDDEFFQLDRDRFGFFLQEVVNGQPLRDEMVAAPDFQVSSFDDAGFLWVRWKGAPVLKLHKSRLFITNPVLLEGS